MYHYVVVTLEHKKIHHRKPYPLLHGALGTTCVSVHPVCHLAAQVMHPHGGPGGMGGRHGAMEMLRELQQRE
jgi:hypothetical protein